MGFLAGFTQGLGQGAKDLNQNYMNMQLERYRGAAKIWESLANDQSYHPNIRQQFAQRAATLNSPNLFDANWRKSADSILKENPHEAVQHAINAMQATGTTMPSVYGQDSGAIDDPARLRGEQAYQEAHGGQRAMLEMLGMSGSQAPQQPVGNQPQGQPSAVPQAPTQGNNPFSSLFTSGAPQGSTLDGLIQRDRLTSTILKRPTMTITEGPFMNGQPTVRFGGGLYFQKTGEQANEGIATRSGAQLEAYLDTRTNRLVNDYFPPGDPRLQFMVKPLEKVVRKTVKDPLSLTERSVDTKVYINPITGQEVSGTGSTAPDGPQLTITQPPTAGAVPQQNVPQTGSNATTEASTGAIPTPKPVARKVTTPSVSSSGDIVQQILTNPGTVAKMNPEQYRQAEMAMSAKGYTMPSPESLSGPAVHKEEQSYEGFAALHDIAQIAKNNKDIGPVAGRVGTFLNERFAKTGVLGFLHDMRGVNDNRPPEVVGSETVNGMIQAVGDIANDPKSIDRLSNELRLPRDRAAKAAQDLAYLLTRTRALNAAEVAAIAGGGGRGITRLFLAMQPYMLNITQDPNFLVGHGSAIADLLGSDVAEVHNTRWGAAGPKMWAAIPPARQKLLQEFGQAGRFGQTDTSSSPPTIVGKSGQYTGKTLYLDPKDGKYYPTQHQ